MYDEALVYCSKESAKKGIVMGALIRMVAIEEKGVIIQVQRGNEGGADLWEGNCFST